MKQYQIIKQIGKGSYGYVWQVKSKEDQKKYALKKIFDAFRNQTDSQRTYRQIQVLSHVHGKQIVKLQKIIPSKGKNDIYLVFQYVDTDLLSLNKSLIHRDLKPANILVNSQSQVKICDFGLVRSSKITQNQNNKTQNVATKWYRAPQVLLGSNNYGISVDMWSFGCIVAQTLLRKHIVNALSTQQIFLQMLQIDRNATNQDLDQLKIQGLQKLIINFKLQYKNIQKLFGYKYKQFIPLIAGCLKINPKKRLSVQQALNLPLFSQMKEILKQNSKVQNHQQFIFNLDDNIKFDIQTYQKAIMNHVRSNRSQKRIYYPTQQGNEIQTNEKDQNIKLKRNQSQQDKQNKNINKSRISKNKYLLKNHSNQKQNNQIRNQKVLKSCHIQAPMRRIIDQIYVDRFNRLNTLIEQKSIKKNHSNDKLISRYIDNQNKILDKLPYFLPQKIYKKPKNVQNMIPKLSKNVLNSETKTRFFNKYCQKGIKKLQQVEQFQINQQKQMDQQRKLIKKYEMQITTSIYSSFHRGGSSNSNSFHGKFSINNNKFPQLSKRIY